MNTITRKEWFDQIKLVEREYKAARFAINRFLKEHPSDSESEKWTINKSDLRRLTINLGPTYLIRIFATFESGLRSYWQSYRPTQPVTEQLINSVASKRSICDRLVTEVHLIREFRNIFVHQSDQVQDSPEIDDARGTLNEYFSHLPDTWTT